MLFKHIENSQKVKVYMDFIREWVPCRVIKMEKMIKDENGFWKFDGYTFQVAGKMDGKPFFFIIENQDDLGSYEMKFIMRKLKK